MEKYLLFLCLIFIFSCKPVHKKVQTTNGIIDLNDWDFKNDGITTLDGKWDFYWDKLYTPDDFINDSIKKIKPETIIVPGVWNDKSKISKIHKPRGFATYRVKIKTNIESQKLAIKIVDISSSYKVWINNILILETGTVSSERDKMKPEFRSKIAIFDKTAKEFFVTIQVSNYFYL